MAMKKILTVCILLILLHATSNAQLRNYNPITQSPHATSLIRYGDIPVGGYTGTASIQIPIYTINAKDFQLPISVSYHSSGIKVADESGPIGLGWSLNFGGSISHIVNGRNDLDDPQFDDLGYINNVTPAHGSVPDYSLYSCVSGDIFYPFINVFHTVGGVGNLIAGKLSFYNAQGICSDSVPAGFNPFASQESLYDTEPDYFYYSFGNYSGKFFYDKKSKSFQPLDRSKIKIVYTPSSSTTSSSGSGWRITTEDGVVYNFFQAEEHKGFTSPITVSGGGSSLSPEFNNYHVTSIQLVNGETINFEYSVGTRTCVLANYNEAIDGYTSNGLNNWIFGDLRSLLNKSNSLSQQSYIPVFLDQVTFRGGKIDLTWQSRQDVMNEKRLVKIEVKNNYDRIIRTVDFDNGVYFQGVDGNRPNFSYANGTMFTCDCSTAGLTELDVQLKRLKLRSLKISDQEKPYQFFYDESKNLPAKMSFAVDYWGYYNGNISATTYMPDLNRLYIATPPEIMDVYDHYTYFGVQDRRANLTYAKTCLLNKIIYPTGGSSEFDYELNTFDNFQFMSSTDNAFQSAYANMTYYGSPSSVSTSGSSSMPFTILQNQTVNVTTKIDLKLYDNQNPALNYRVQIINSNGQTVYERKLREWNTAIPPAGQESCSDIGTTSSLFLAAGVYTAKVFNEGNIQTCVHTGAATSATVSINVTYKGIPSGYFESKGGGMRVKQIKDLDENVVAKTKIFSYSGGQLMDFPNFSRAYNSFFWLSTATPDLNPTIQQVALYNTRKISFSGTAVAGIATGPEGNYVGYAKVTESLIQGLVTNGAIVTHFWNGSLDCNNISLAPCSNRVENGLVLKKEILDYSGKRIKVDSMLYDVSDQISSYGIIGEKVSDGSVDFTISNNGNLIAASYLLHTYPINSSKILPKSTISTSYNAGLKLIERTDYTYNPYHAVATETRYTSNATLKKSSYQYVYDFPAIAPFDTMVERNQLSSLVKKNESIVVGGSSNLIGSESWNYELKKGFGVATLYQNSLDGSNIYKNILSILSTDSNNNPIEVLEKDGTITTYIYQPFLNTPAVVGRNVRKNQLYYEGYNSSDANDGRTGGYYNGAQTPLSFIKPDSKAYYIDYWYYSSGVWQYQRSVYQNNFIIPYSMIDEVRIYPEDCDITSYYNIPLVGLSSTQDRNGRFTFYSYDNLNRLSHISDNDNNIIKSFKYHYKK
jgi:hypothetical protein